MASMDIAERRKPHDGRIKVALDGNEYDLRVSVLPSGFGETVNMRILSRSSSFVDLNKLGLSEVQLPKVMEMCALPHGVILLTGPTGSGKTTTLYALLAQVNSHEVKTITVEDPIEYQMHGISQIQTHAKIGLTFASILRSILRHDPDVILIGEIRDAETADIAVRASLTGHLVFSTLHTNDAPSAITRLSDMGIEPYLISSCLEGVIAQRLVRRVCKSCAHEEQPNDALLREVAHYYPDRMEKARFLTGAGCPDCSFTGYHGRSAIIEVMAMNDRLREMVVQRKHSNEIKEVAIQQGMITLRADGWLKVLNGITSIDEVMRVARRSEVE
jgi:type II secretory ATPase GspE/PulE/Tfp pilus assembly ATPase PilB-like protein